MNKIANNTINKLGYACINMTLGDKKITTNRTMIKKTFLEKGLKYCSELALKNVLDLQKILEWNVKNNILFYRMSSDMIPWMSEYNIDDLPDIAKISAAYKSVGDYAAKNGIRLTMHPGPYNKLAGTSKDVLTKTIKELDDHAKIMDMMGLPESRLSKINIHIGGTYGDKKDTIKRFNDNFELLKLTTKLRLTVENDDRLSLFSVKDLKEGLRSDIPITFDFHHHSIHPDGLSEEAALKLALETWTVKPVVHYSESLRAEQNDKTIKECAHSNYIIKKINSYNLYFDCMIEAKAKELALQNYLKLLNIEGE